MKKVIFASILSLAGCSFSLQVGVSKVPDPIDPQVVAALKNHEETLVVLVEDYKKRVEVKK